MDGGMMRLKTLAVFPLSPRERVEVRGFLP